MEMTLKYICFCIYVTLINGTKNTTELYESEHLENNLTDIPSCKEIYEKLKLKLDNLLYKFDELEDLKTKTSELENENLKLKERLTNTEENLKNSEEGLKRIVHEQRGTKEVFRKADADLNELKTNFEERVKKSAEGLKGIGVSYLVPIGFIYVQLPFQQEPITLWPGTTWINISNKYSDHFFRVEGPNTRPFGEIQTDAFQGHWHELTYEARYKNNEGLTIGGGMTRYTFGNTYEPDEKTVKHVRNAVKDLTNGYPRIANETRPINYAVRVWKRTK